MNGKRAEQRAAVRLNVPGLPVEHVPEEDLGARTEHAELHQEHDGARVAAELAQDASPRSSSVATGVTPGASVRSTSFRNAASRLSASVSSRSLAGVAVAGSCPCARTGARRSGRPRPSRGSTRGASSPPPPAPEHGPRGRAVARGRGRRSARRGRGPAGSFESAVARLTRASWPPDRLPAVRAARPATSTAAHHLGDPLRPRRGRPSRSSGGSPRRTGRGTPTGPGSVADPGAERRRAGARQARSPSPPWTIWTPTIARISVDFPHPDGPERAGDLAGRRRGGRSSWSTSAPPRTTRSALHLDGGGGGGGGGHGASTLVAGGGASPVPQRICHESQMTLTARPNGRRPGAPLGGDEGRQLAGAGCGNGSVTKAK